MAVPRKAVTRQDRNVPHQYDPQQSRRHGRSSFVTTRQDDRDAPHIRTNLDGARPFAVRHRLHDRRAPASSVVVARVVASVGSFVAATAAAGGAPRILREGARPFRRSGEEAHSVHGTSPCIGTYLALLLREGALEVAVEPRREELPGERRRREVPKEDDVSRKERASWSSPRRSHVRGGGARCLEITTCRGPLHRGEDAVAAAARGFTHPVA